MRGVVNDLRSMCPEVQRTCVFLGRVATRSKNKKGDVSFNKTGVGGEGEIKKSRVKVNVNVEKFLRRRFVGRICSRRGL